MNDIGFNPRKKMIIENPVNVILTNYELKPIGIVRSPYWELHDAPQNMGCLRPGHPTARTDRIGLVDLIGRSGTTLRVRGPTR